MNNKVLATITADKGEFSTAWNPINFSIYSPLFFDLMDEALEAYTATIPMKIQCFYEVLFVHRIERDAAGAVHTEYFEPVYTDRCPLV